MKKNVLIVVSMAALLVSVMINISMFFGGETTVDLEQDRIHFNQLFDTISHHEYEGFQTTFIEQEDTTYQNRYISKDLSLGTRDFMSFDGTDNDYNTYRTFQVKGGVDQANIITCTLIYVPNSNLSNNLVFTAGAPFPVGDSLELPIEETPMDILTFGGKYIITIYDPSTVGNRDNGLGMINFREELTHLLQENE